jgi:hypothetical protein
MSDKKMNKYDNEHCNNKMTFEECELAILRGAVDKNDKNIKKQFIQSQDIKKLSIIIEKFLIKRKTICYGGSAINAILPKSAQIYDKEFDAPDYDFFVINGVESATELANDFFEAGYSEVEAKPGVHKLTYKIFVNFIPIADISQLNPDIFYHLWKDATTIGGIRYAPANYLRMGIYLELSRPEGFIERWEKIYKRLSLLDKYHPIKLLDVCKTIDFYTNLEETARTSHRHTLAKNHQPKSKVTGLIPNTYINEENIERPSSPDIQETNNQSLYVIIRDTLIDEEVVFFGGYASLLYQRYIIHTKHQGKLANPQPKRKRKTEPEIQTETESETQAETELETQPETERTLVLPSDIDKDVLLESKIEGGYMSKDSLEKEKDNQTIIKKFGHLKNVPDFDVLTETPEKTALVLREQLHASGFRQIHEIVHPPIDEIIPVCYEIKVGDKSVANIFGTVGCHNYNKITIRSREVKVATIDTIMSFYLAFYYTKRFYHIRERILCFAKFLFDLEHYNRLNQTGLLQRFSMNCVGKQNTLQDIRSIKTRKYEDLKYKKDSKEYQEWFFMYRPADNLAIVKHVQNKHHSTKELPHAKENPNIIMEEPEKEYKDKPNYIGHRRNKFQRNYKPGTKKRQYSFLKFYPKRKTMRREPRKKPTNPKIAYKRDPLVKQLFGK